MVKTSVWFPGSPFLDQPLQEADSKVQAEGSGYFPFYHTPLNSIEMEHPPSSRKRKPLPPTRDFLQCLLFQMSGQMPSCEEPAAFDSGVALWHFLLVPVLTQANASGLKNRVSIPELTPLPATFFLLASSSRQAACAKAAGHTLVISAYSQCLVPGWLSPPHQLCLCCSLFSRG